MAAGVLACARLAPRERKDAEGPANLISRSAPAARPCAHRTVCLGSVRGNIRSVRAESLQLWPVTTVCRGETAPDQKRRLWYKTLLPPCATGARNGSYAPRSSLGVNPSAPPAHRQRCAQGPRPPCRTLRGDVP